MAVGLLYALKSTRYLTDGSMLSKSFTAVDRLEALSQNRKHLMY